MIPSADGKDQESTSEELNLLPLSGQTFCWVLLLVLWPSFFEVVS